VKTNYAEFKLSQRSITNDELRCRRLIKRADAKNKRVPVLLIKTSKNHQKMLAACEQNWSNGAARIHIHAVLLKY